MIKGVAIDKPAASRRNIALLQHKCQPGASSGLSPPSPVRCYTAKDSTCPQQSDRADVSFSYARHSLAGLPLSQVVEGGVT